MKVIVGLGNPGSNYSLTKHNFGFWVVDKLVKQSSLKYKAGKGEYVFAQSNEYMFVKPTTYMNNSGIAIKQFLNYYKLDTSSLIIIYDDIDIDLGKIKFRAKGTDGGHNGIKSVIYHLGTDSFDRLKLGIATSMNMRPSEQYVLKAFPKKYNNLVDEVIENATSGISCYLENGISETMNNFN
jgi:PTH1 family peptidyl-tRNA hydrolase